MFGRRSALSALCFRNRGCPTVRDTVSFAHLSEHRQSRCLSQRAFRNAQEHDAVRKASAEGGITCVAFRAFSSEKELIDSPALHHLASQLRNLPALGDITLQFSRSLITRQLLSDAYALQIEHSGGAECMTALQLSLPQPTESFHDLPPSPEPIMVEIFHGDLAAQPNDSDHACMSL